MNNLINSLLNWFRAHPIAIIILIFVLVLALLWFKDSIGGQIERFNQWRFDKAVAEKQAEIDRLSEENKKLLEEAKKAFALGEAKELERDAAYAELEKYGAAAKAAVAAQKQAAEQYAAEKAAIDVDVSTHQRCLDLCKERAEVGYPCRQNYCDRYAK